MRFGSAAVVVLAPVLVVGCGSDGGVEPTSTTTTTIAPEEQVLADYREAWAVLEEIGEDPDPTAPGLEATRIGPALERTQSLMVENAQAGIVTRGPSEFDPLVKSIDGDRALVLDCVVDHSKDYIEATDEMVDEPGPTTYPIEASLVRAAGFWKTESYEVRDQLDVNGKPCERS